MLDILGGTEGLGRGNKFNKEVDIIIDEHANHYYRFLVCTNTIIYNNQACHAMPYHVIIHLPQLI